MYEIERRVGVCEVDRDGLLSCRGALDALCDCCQFQVPTLAGGRFEDFLKEFHLGMFLVYRQMDWIRRPAYGETVYAGTGIYECKNFYGFRNSVIRDASGKICIGGYAIGAFVDLETGRPAKLPQIVIDTMEYEPRLEMEYTPRKIAIPAIETEDGQILHRTVTENLLDFNGHLNSNWYVTFAEELLPEGFVCKRLRIEYKMQAKLGETLLISSLAGENGSFIVRVDDEAGVRHAVLEFSR